MQPFTLGRLAHAVGAATPAHPAAVARGVCTDTRSLEPGALFVALRGERFDGTRFVGQALAGGAAAALVNADAPLPQELARDERVLRVACTRRALSDFARSYRSELGFTVIGITGSAGKTTTKDLTYHLLERAGIRAVKADKSFNNEIGVPLTLFKADEHTEAVVVEIGTNAPGEIAALARVARPDIAAITCIGASHLEGLGGIAGVAREKLSLLSHLRPAGVAVLNADDRRLRAAATRRQGRTMTVGLRHGALRARVRSRGWTWQCELLAPDRPPQPFELPLPGEHVLTDALLALAIGAELGLDPCRAARELASYRPANVGRLGKVEVGPLTLIDDTYNANPESVLASLAVLSEVAAPQERVAVLGSMLELGHESEARHWAIGEAVARLGVARLVTVGSEASAIAAGALSAGLPVERARVVAHAEEVPAALAGLLDAPRTLLFKASRGVALERGLEATAELVRNTTPSGARPRAA